MQKENDRIYDELRRLFQGRTIKKSFNLQKIATLYGHQQHKTQQKYKKKKKAQQKQNIMI